MALKFSPSKIALCTSLKRYGPSAPLKSVSKASMVADRSEYSLSREQREAFEEQGYLLLPGFASRAECQQLKDRVNVLLKDFDPSTVRSIFSTRNQEKKSDNYFSESGGNISFFLEEKAFDETTGKLKQEKDLCVNKIGHALHDLDPVFRRFSRNDRVAGVIKNLGYKRPVPVQSMYIFKQPRIGGEVVPHQDSTFIYTEPMSCIGLWWALEDATVENGCLWAQPGIHKQGLSRRFLMGPDGAVSFDAPRPDYDLSKFVPLECPAGTLVLLHGENVHYSAENTSPTSRHSYSMHVVETADNYKWAEGNWLSRPDHLAWQPLYE